MKKIVKQVNHKLSELYADRFINKQPYLVGIYLHKLYPSKKEIVPANGTISEGVTVAELEQLITYFKKRNFQFINEHDLLDESVAQHKKNIFLSFDDGYFNNTAIIPLLNKHKVKATFYISTNHCEQEKYYWWDVLAKERSAQNLLTNEELKTEINKFYQLNWKEQEQVLIDEFGKDSVFGNNEFMRPMNKQELKSFSQNEFVTIGNHTNNHQNLSIYSNLEVKECIVDANNYLESLIGTKVTSIAYPYGFYNEKVQEIAKSVGITLAQTVKPGKAAIPNLNLMELQRFQLSGYFNITDQCRGFDTDFSLFQQLKKVVKR